MILGRPHRVRFQRDDGAPAAQVERGNLQEQFQAGFQIADLEVRIRAAAVVQQHGRLHVEYLHLKLLRVAAVETRLAPHLDRIRRLVQHRAVRRRFRPH